MQNPIIETVNGYWSLKMRKNPNPINIDTYCDSDLEHKLSHPKMLNYSRINNMTEFYIKEGNRFHWMERTFDRGYGDCGYGFGYDYEQDDNNWCYWEIHNGFDKGGFPGPYAQWLPAFTYYEDLCKKMKPEYSAEEVLKCTMAVMLDKRHYYY